MQLGFDKDVFYSQARTSCRRAMEAGAANDDVLEFYARLTCLAGPKNPRPNDLNHGGTERTLFALRVSVIKY